MEFGEPCVIEQTPLAKAKPKHLLSHLNILYVRFGLQLHGDRCGNMFQLWRPLLNTTINYRPRVTNPAGTNHTNLVVV